MSTILDSLKKSSEKRGEDSGSSIDNFSFSEKHNRRPSGLFWAMLFSALIVFSLYYYFFYMNVDSDNANNESLAKVSNTTTTKSEEGSTLKEVATKPQSSDKKTARPDSQLVKERLKEGQAADKLQWQQAIRKSEVNNKTSSPLTDNAVKINRVSKGSPKASVTAKKEVTGNTEQNDSQSNKNKVIKVEHVAEVPVQQYQYLYQLPFSIRKEIPKIKLNVHVFDKDKENRVVVVNGEAYAIGDMIEELLLIFDITPEGLVLDYNGTKFMIPKL